MRYQEIIDYATETRAERLARLATMYGNDDADAHEQEAETDLCRAKAEKLRADALAAVAKVEAEYEELALQATEQLLKSRIPTKAVRHPNDADED